MKVVWKSPRFLVGVGISLAYALSIIGIMAQLGDATSFIWWLPLLPFVAWCAAPIVAPLFFRSWIITVGVAVIAAWGMREYNLHLFGPGARSTSPLAFIFLPIYQWMAVASLIGLNWVVERITRR